MDPYRHGQRVRGGFSPLRTGNWTPNLSGLGDLCDPTDLACQMSGQTNMNLITGSPSDVSGANTLTSILGGVPMAAWLAIGLSVFALVSFSKR
jgi:hypothetical protein